MDECYWMPPPETTDEWIAQTAAKGFVSVLVAAAVGRVAAEREAL